MTQRTENLDGLENFYGTEQYYRGAAGALKYTDGVKYVAEKAGAYWLLQLIGTLASTIYTNQAISEYDKEFLTADLEVQEDDSAVLSITNGNKKELSNFEIPFTDFPAEKCRFFITNEVILLPTEY